MTDKLLSTLRTGDAPSKRVSRRRLLKGAAGVGDVAIGSGIIKGFPTVWAQNIKDVTLTHVGMSYSTIIDIARQATKDLGFKVEMAVTDHPGFLNRVTTQPDFGRYRRWRASAEPPRRAARQLSGDRGQEDQALGQDDADLYQG